MRIKIGTIFLIESGYRVIVLKSEEIIRGKLLVLVRRLTDNKEIYLPTEAFEGAQSELGVL